MKVILLKAVKGLGKEGDLVDAKDGYARNYLLPNGLAEEATKGNIKQLKQKKKAEKKRREEEHKEALKLKEKLDNIEIELKRKAGEGGKLFGSITSKDISDALKNQYNLNIDKRNIDMEENIKSLGTTVVKAKVYSDIVANIRVKVVEEK